MKKFLTDFMTENRSPDEMTQKTYRGDWETMLTRVKNSCGDRLFRPGGRALNVAFFDSFSVL